MKMTRIMLATLALAAIASAQDVSTNFDQTADFTKFKTYKWVEIPGGVKLDDLTSRQLTGAVDTQLAMKGLTKTDKDPADLYIGYQVAIDQEKQLNAYSTGGVGFRMGGGMTTATTSTITNGSFNLDMYDSSKKELVWRGVATKAIDSKASGDKRQKNIEKGAEKLLKNYPPKKK